MVKVNLPIQVTLLAALMTFFTNIVKNYLPQNLDQPQEHYLLKQYIESKLQNTTKFTIPPIPEERVLELLVSLNEKKATGLDGISNKILKISAPVLANTVTKILNLSIKKWQISIPMEDKKSVSNP